MERRMAERRRQLRTPQYRSLRGQQVLSRSSKDTQRLGEILKERLRLRYGRLPGASAVIAARVADFVATSNITEAALRALDHVVSQELRSQKPPELRHAIAPEFAPRNLRATTSASTVRRVSGAAEPKATLQQPELEEEWEALAQMKEEMYKQELRTERQHKVQRQQRLQSELEQQMETRRRLNFTERAELGSFYSRHLEQLEKEELNSKEQTAARRRRLQEEGELLNQQRLAMRRQQRIKKLQIQREERAFVAAIREGLMQERFQTSERRQRQAAYIQGLIQESERRRRSTCEAERAEREQDKQALEEYLGLLDKQDSEAKFAKEQKTRTLVQRAHFTDPNVLLALRKKREEEEERFRRQMAQQLLEHKRMEEQRAAKAKELREELRMTYEQQMAEKQARERSETMRDTKQAEAWRKDRDLFEEEERKNQERQRRIYAEHVQFIQKQMQERLKERRKRPHWTRSQPRLAEAEDMAAAS